MTNELTPRDADGRVDDILDRALRQIVDGDRGDIPWPADEATLAYLKGEASDAQREEVQTVLTQSAEYRRFLTDTEAMIREAESEEGTRSFDATVASGDRTTRNGATPLRAPWWGMLLRPVVWIPVAAVAAFLIWFGTRPQQMPAGTEAIAFAPYSQLDATDFVPFNTRGAGGAPTDTGVYATPESAAVRVLQTCITFNTENMTYDLKPQSSRLAPKVRTHYVSLTLSDSTGREIVATTSTIPATLPFDSTQITAWLIVPPSTTLYQVGIPTKLVSAGWPATPNARGCLTFSYRTEGGYRATPGQVISF